MLCPINDNVDAANDLILSRLLGESRTYQSMDKVLQNSPLATLTDVGVATRLEYVHTLRPGNLPPHNLTLKIGSIVMLTRNLSIREGLVNGIRLQILRMFEQIIECLILTGPNAKKKTLIASVRFEHGLKKSDRGVAFSRMQFPLRMAFAISINKAQGLLIILAAPLLLFRPDTNSHGTFAHHSTGLIFLYFVSLNKSSLFYVFSHGHIYVAYSRVKTMEGIRVFSGTTDVQPGTIVNVVWKELLDPIQPESSQGHQRYIHSIYD